MFFYLQMTKKMTYAESGVDIHQENKAINALASRITYKRTGMGTPLTDIGHYAGLIEFGEYALALTTDGVGSKVLIAHEMKRWDTVGIDCIAMNVNDLLVMGVEPLSFVDYLAIDHPEEELMSQLGEGLQRGAQLSQMTIVGGETASLPEIVNGFDLAGTCLGAVKKDRIITGEKIIPGDVLVGVPSSGLHSNGYTLARRIVEQSPYDYHDIFPYDPKTTIGDELLTPTRIYIEILDVISKCEVHGMAHITGSGLLKLSRITDLGFDLHSPLDPQPIFTFLQEQGNVDDREMYRTFNMGMGIIIVLPEKDAACAASITGGRIVGEIVDSGIKVGDLEIV
jgi:phosphoribosylformylglycinamidine cyclo-ligase